MYKANRLPLNFDFESKNILKKLADAKSALAELKGFVYIKLFELFTQKRNVMLKKWRNVNMKNFLC